MSIGKRTRLNRLFGHASGRLCSIAVDHFIGYGEGIPPGLSRIASTLAAIVAGQPDAVTMQRGIVCSAWAPYAGKVPLILQSTIARPDDSVHEQVAGPEDAVRLGAEALAVAAFVRGPTEGMYLRTIAECAAAAARYDLPVIAHIYPREYRDGVRISFAPADVAWAVRCALECGADVIKAPFCHDAKAFAQIVSECPVPVVAAGGPKCATLEEALTMFEQVVRSGARGVTVGRNVWGHERVTDVIRAIKCVVHGQINPRDALTRCGLDGEQPDNAK
jgi:class I fructose-bisphosphate aldolase